MNGENNSTYYTNSNIAATNDARQTNLIVAGGLFSWLSHKDPRATKNESNIFLNLQQYRPQFFSHITLIGIRPIASVAFNDEGQTDLPLLFIFGCCSGRFSQTSVQGVSAIGQLYAVSTVIF